MRHEAQFHIPRRAGRDWRYISRSDGLPGAERCMGTVACQETSGHAQAYGVACWGICMTWRKLYCLKPNLQEAHSHARRKDA